MFKKSQIIKDLNYEMFFKDGLSDISLGAFMLSYWLAVILNQIFIIIIFAPLIPVIMKFFKNRFIYPRLGYFKPKEDPNKGKLMFLLILVLLIIGLILFSLSFFYKTEMQDGSFFNFIKTHASLSVGILWVGIILFLGINYKVLRYIVYSVISLGLFVISIFNLINEDLSLIISSLLLILNGFLIFALFLKKYPAIDGSYDLNE